jgi:hypothetical protein
MTHNIFFLYSSFLPLVFLLQKFFIICVHYLCLIGRVYVFYVGHIDKSSLYKTLFHCNTLSKQHHHHHHLCKPVNSCRALNSTEVCNGPAYATPLEVLEQGVSCEYFRSENVRNTSVSLDIGFKLVFAY